MCSSTVRRAPSSGKPMKYLRSLLKDCGFFAPWRTSCAMTGEAAASPSSRSLRSRVTGIVSRLRSKSIQTVESTRITGHAPPHGTNVVVRRNQLISEQVQDVSLPAARNVLSQGEIHGLPLGSHLRQPHRLLYEAVVEHDIGTHRYTS